MPHDVIERDREENNQQPLNRLYNQWLKVLQRPTSFPGSLSY